MLFDLKDQLQQVAGILDPGRSTATIKKMESESDLKIFEDKIQDVDNRLICVSYDINMYICICVCVHIYIYLSFSSVISIITFRSSNCPELVGLQ